MEQRTIYALMLIFRNPLSLIVIILGGMWLAGLLFDALAR